LVGTAQSHFQFTNHRQEMLDRAPEADLQ